MLIIGVWTVFLTVLAVKQRIIATTVVLFYGIPGVCLLSIGIGINFMVDGLKNKAQFIQYLLCMSIGRGALMGFLDVSFLP